MAQDVMQALAEWPQILRTERGALVSTSCILPSGSLLTVSIQPVIDGWIVCDEGAAVWEAESGGHSVERAIRGLSSRLNGQGLKVENGKIYSGRVNSSELPYMVAYLATAAADAAKWLSNKARVKDHIDVVDRLPEVLKNFYPDFISAEPLTLRGDTDKQYTFDNVLVLPNRSRLVLDAVRNHDGSIKSRVLANLDVSRAKPDKIIQRIVYDEQEDWSQQDLALLSVGAPAVAISRVVEMVRREAA